MKGDQGPRGDAGSPATGDTALLQGPKGDVVGIPGCYHIRVPIRTV